MRLKLRYYQQEGIDALWNYFATKQGNPLLLYPVGTGKSVIIAGFLESVFRAYPGQKVLVCTHVKKLIEQNYAKLKSLWPNAPAGIYSSGLGKKDIYDRIIFCGVASIVKNIQAFGRVDLMIVDEADLISQNEESMYQMVIAELHKTNPGLKVIGLTATAWRAGQGYITTDGIFTDVAIDYTTIEKFNQLFDEGWLTPLIPLRTSLLLDITGVHKLAGEFKQAELELAVDKDEITYKALNEAIKYGSNRKSWLIFSSGVKHCESVHRILNALGIDCAIAHSKMPMKECDKNINDWIDGRVTAIVSNGMLTTGIDNPSCDLILVLRPTMSSRLWVQMLGRGIRCLYAEGYPLNTNEERLKAIREGQKPNCLVLDFAANARRLGPINDPVIPRQKGKGSAGDAPIRICDNCNMYNHASARYCGGVPIADPRFDVTRGCGTEFVTQTKIQQTASSEALIKREELPEVKWFTVDSVTYHVQRKAGKADYLRISYFCNLMKFQEFVHFETPGVLQRKASNWWKDRSMGPVPLTTVEAHAVAAQLDVPKQILVWYNKQWPEVMKVNFSAEVKTESTSEVPF
jgi:DNA repair protein RadD